MVINSPDVLLHISNHVSGSEYLHQQQNPTSYLGQEPEASMTSPAPSSGPSGPAVNRLETSLTCEIGSMEDINRQISLMDGTMVSQDALLENHFAQSLQEWNYSNHGILLLPASPS
jgi:hypothetical protein